MILADFEPVEVVQRAIDSLKKYVDGGYITITHKNKNYSKSSKLIKLIQKYNFHLSHFMWTEKYAEARQFALEQVPQGDDVYMIWIDADDIVDGAENIPKIVQDMYAKNINATYFNYLYQVDLDDKGDIKNVIVEHARERIILNNGQFKWYGNLHELLIEKGESNKKKYRRNDLTVIHLNHHKNLEEDLDRNIKILEATILEDKGKDPRNRFYLAKAYMDKANYASNNVEIMYQWLEKAKSLLDVYLNGSGEIGSKDYLEPSGWSEERSLAWEALAYISSLQGQYKISLECYKNAIDESPQFPNYYFGMARTYLLLEDFKKAEIWLNIGTTIPKPQTSIVIAPTDWKLNALEISYKINIHKLNLKWAKEDLEKILEINPNEKITLDRLEKIKLLIRENEVSQSIVKISKYLEEFGEKEKIPNLLNAVPSKLEQEQFVNEMKRLFLPPKEWEDNEIAILCGPGFENWSPKSIETGLGGSEEAVVYLSKELSKLGWKITVYGSPDQEGEYDGVLYKNWHSINQKDKFNILILWRSVGFIDFNPNAKFTLLWAHDVPQNIDFTKERLDKIDKIAVLSEFHKSLFRMTDDGETFTKIPDDKFFLTSNGIPDFKLEDNNA